MLLTRASWQAGRKYIGPVAAASLGLASAAGLLQRKHPTTAKGLWRAAGGTTVLGLAITLAFRDIARPYEQDPDTVYSPASGTVKFADDGLVAIFMWLVTRHTVLAPAFGQLLSAETEGTAKRAAMWASASENYKYVLTFDTGLVVKMISGLIARRVLVWAPVNGSIRPGDRLGFICLASRVDVVFQDRPGWHLEILVKPRQIVRQGQPIARWVRDAAPQAA